MIYIAQETGKRVNIHTPYKGRSRLDTEEIRAAVGVIGIEDDPKPADFDAQFYVVKEDWDTTQRPYTIYERKSDEQIAEIRWERIKAKRDELTDNGGCLVATKWFHTDPKSKQQQMALVMLGVSIPAGLQWKTMDGSFIEMTQPLAAQLFGAQVQREQMIFAHAEALNLDPTADIDTGWPARYVTEAS